MRIVVLCSLALAVCACDSVFGANAPIVVDSSGQGGGADHGDQDVGGGPGAGGGTAGAPPIACDGPRAVRDGATGACFQPSTTQATWDDANAACEASGGKLATVESAEQLAIVQSLVRDTTWIGAKRVDGDTFAWVSGAPFGFSDWVPGAPSSVGDCVAVDGTLLAFTNADCSALRVSVCETGGP